MRKQCHANSVPWDKIDEATEKLLATVKDRLVTLTSPPRVAATALKQQWALETELGKILCRIVNAFLFNVNEERFDLPSSTCR
jgi:hypothetical protein